MSTSHREPLCIDATHPALAGHFPGRPVVPGVVLLDRVLDAAQRRYGLHAHALRLPQVKFLQPLLPGQAVEIAMDAGWPEPAATETRILFRIERAGALLASGELIAPTAIAAALNATGVA